MRTAERFLLEKRAWLLQALSRRQQTVGTTPDARIRREWHRRAESLFIPRVEMWSQRCGLRYDSLAFRYKRTNWGCCTSKDRIVLNTALVNLPVELADYVIIHELCHTKEKNHSPRFWALVESQCPGWKDLRRQLRNYRPLVGTF